MQSGDYKLYQSTPIPKGKKIKLIKMILITGIGRPHSLNATGEKTLNSFEAINVDEIRKNQCFAI